MRVKTRDILVPTITLFIICLVAAALLGYVNSITSPIIDNLAVKSAEESRISLVPEAAKFEEATVNGNTYYIGYDKDQNVVGYVFTTVNTSKAYGSEITVMTGLDANGAIKGIDLLDINETPGLGMNAKKDSFKNQFVGKSGSLTVTKSGSPSDTEIEALTSATITSKAVTSAVNAALELYSEIGGGNNG